MDKIDGYCRKGCQGIAPSLPAKANAGQVAGELTAQFVSEADIQTLPFIPHSHVHALTLLGSLSRNSEF